MSVSAIDPSLIGDVGEPLKSAEKTKNQTNVTEAGDILTLKEEPKMREKSPGLSFASEEPEKKMLQKHTTIKSAALPAKMSRKNVGMAEKLTEKDKKRFSGKRGSKSSETEMQNEPSHGERLLEETRDFMLHVFLLIVVTTIAASSIPLCKYYYHDVLTHFLTDSSFITEAHLQKTFWDIVILDQIWDYMNGILVPLIYAGVYDNITASYREKLNNQSNVLLLNDNIIVTLPRIRQVRVRNDSCQVPEGFVYIFDSCYHFFSPEVEEREPYGVKEGTLWTYSDASVTLAEPVRGEISTYSGGGYFMDFTLTQNETEAIFRQMWNYTWIDHGTRAIIIDLVTYTQRDNLFCIVTLLAELPPSGGVITSGDVRVQKLLRYESTEDFIILGFEGAFAILLLMFTVDSIIKLSTRRMRYIMNLWNILDWVILVFGYAAVTIGVLRYIKVNNHLSGLRYAMEHGEHFSFHQIRDVQTTFELLIGGVGFWAWLKTCRYASLTHSGSLILRAFRKVRTELVALTLMLLLLIFGFAMFAHVIFGTHVKYFNSIANSVFTLIALFAGGLNFYKLCEEAQPVLSPLFFIGYIFVVMVLFVNWFTSAVVYGLKEATQEVDLTGENIFIGDVIRNAFKKILRFCRCQKLYAKLDETNPKNIQQTDYDIINKLLDRNGFSRLERDLFLRRHGMTAGNISSKKPLTANIDDIIADLNGMNRFYIETEEHERILERIDDLKKRLEVLDHSLSDMVVKVDVLIDKVKYQDFDSKLT